MAMELKTTGVNGFVKPAELTNMETLLNAVNDELLTGNLADVRKTRSALKGTKG